MNFLSDEEKAAKARLIANTAKTIFKEQSYPEITMAVIAKRAGVSKGTLFNYFKTKENVFMYLLLDGYQQYFAGLINRLNAAEINSWDEFANWLLVETKDMATNETVILRLNSLRGPILEPGADRKQTLAQRERLYAINEELGEVIHQKLPQISVSAASHLFVIQSSIVSGLMNLSGLSDFNSEQIGDFKDFNVNVVAESIETFQDYLNGFSERNGIK